VRGESLMRALLIRWLVLAVAVWVTTALVSGIDVNGGAGTYLLVAIVLASVNAVLGTILRLLTFPLIVLTLGIFSLVINALMLMVTDSLMDSFDVDGFGPALLGAVIIAGVTLVLDLVLQPSRYRAAQ
jgi:putative membrane protein